MIFCTVFFASFSSVLYCTLSTVDVGQVVKFVCLFHMLESILLIFSMTYGLQNPLSLTLWKKLWCTVIFFIEGNCTLSATVQMVRYTLHLSLILSLSDYSLIVHCIPQQENILYFFHQHSSIITSITVKGDTRLYKKDYGCDKKWALLLFKALPTDPRSMRHAVIKQS